MNGIAVIDIIFAVLIIIFTVRCYLRGFIGELLSMTALVLGLLASLFFYKNGAVFIRERFMPGVGVIPEILAFVILFLVVFIAVKIVEHLLRDIIEGIRLGNVDRFLGIFFGIAEGIVVVSLVLFVLSIQPVFNAHSILEKSLFARILLPFISGGVWNLPVGEPAAMLTGLPRHV
ncbi:MAG: CvpA family protein [Treponema sp.]|jgi:membrane protein required for colicin V production|nr:CvpA family protein [Treponema sp.]